MISMIKPMSKKTLTVCLDTQLGREKRGNNGRGIEGKERKKN